MAESPEVVEGTRIRRERKRVESLSFDREKVGQRIKNMYDNDMTDRGPEIFARLQRYAKYRMWREGKNWPWQDACFSMDSELLTANGWKAVGEMQAGDLVYSRSPEGRAEYRPVAYTVKTMATEAVSFRGKSIDLLVTPNHRMLIQDWAGRSRLVPAAEFVGLPNKAWSIPLTSTWRGESPEKISGLPAREYLRLLGWYVAEGSQNNSGTLAITQSRSANPEKCRIIERDLSNAGVTWNYNRNDFYLRSSTVPAPALDELRSMGVCDEKVLPDHVLDLCPTLLSELLDAMVLGDGHKRRNGHTSYSTTSKALADQAQIIAQKIGMRATITTRIPRAGGVVQGRRIDGTLPLYTVNINKKTAVQVRKLQIAMVTLDHPTEFACVNVPPYNTLYVRRNGIATWCGNTDSAIPDMMTACSRMEDTLHNAVMSSRPPIMAKAMHKVDKEKEEKVTQVIDYQFFEEQPGEEIIGQLAHDFILEGVFTAYTPWIRETRRVKEVRVYDPVPQGMRPADYFLPLVEGFFPRKKVTPAGDGWDFKVDLDHGKRAAVSFYTRDDDQIEMELEREVEMYNGPRVIRKDLQDVLHPARCENLQIRSPSNPMGAQHVILRDYPTIDEIKRLATPDEHGRTYYDLITKEELDKLTTKRMDTSNQQREEQKDTFQGHAQQKGQVKGAESHETLTRLTVFDCFDIDGDGKDEDVVWWYLLETGTMLKAKYLSEVFPSELPRRPFGEGQLFPVPGRRLAIGMLELMEGIHDLMKQFFDQGGDAGTLANAPFFFYRSASNMRPEVLAMSPGEGYPLTDPKNDVVFPQMANSGQSFMFNMISLLTQWDEKVSSIGDLQMGRVPNGKASALRTVKGMQTVLAQGDARPERVLRRFFMGLAQVFQNMHALNEQLLDGKKQFVLLGPNVDPSQSPYSEIQSKAEIRGKFRFTFSANALNTSKEALSAALETFMGVLIQPLSIQLGIVKPDGIYRLMRDYGKSLGPDPDKYMNPPTPAAQTPPILAEEAILLIMNGIMPKGAPLEGLDEHFDKLQVFAQHETEFAHMPPEYVPMFKQYLESMAQQMVQQQKLMEAAGNFGGGGKPGMPGPEGAVPTNIGAPPPVNDNELVDETLAGAGGGANTEFKA